MDEEERNHCCLILLLSRVGLEKLRKFFIEEWDSVGVFAPWTDCIQNGKDLLTKFIPLPYEKDKVQSGNTTKWDLSLFVKALLYSRPPFVPNSKKALHDGLVLLKETRNALCHTPSGRIGSPEFRKLFSGACNALLLVRATPDEFLKVEKDVNQPWHEVLSQIKHCASQDVNILQGIDIITSRLDQLQKTVDNVQQIQQQSQKTQVELLKGQSGLQQGQQEIMQSVEELKSAITGHSSSTSKSSDVENYAINLKEEIKERTEFLLKRIDKSKQKTDDIFINFTIKQKSQQPTSESQEYQRAPTAVRTVKQSSEIFVGENENGEERNPKSILVSGEAGIGKTLFSHKILRDWSTSCIFIPDIKFAYLITFRQLVLLGNEELTLRELLNCSTLLNENTTMDETVMDFIIHHPKQLFLVLDGFDEYREQSKLVGDFESRFTNDINTKMPVAALVSKLIQKKILANSLIMVTSRPGEAIELDNSVPFDKFVELNGFSEEQVIEYVEKYFSSKSEEVKKMAVDKVKGTAQYMSFGRVPLMCFLLCHVIEWEIKNSLTRDNSVPVTLTQFYYEIIKCIERNNREFRNLDEEAALSAVEKTLDNFSRLAAQLVEQDRFTFTLEDLKMLKLPKEEMFNLTSSSLIVCYLVASNSPFPTTTLEYGFAHLTIQEFLAALRFVKMDAMAPVQVPSTMVYTFMSGLLGLDETKNNDKLMLEVLESVSKQVKDDWRRRLGLVRCLYEYGQEKELTRHQLTTNPDFSDWDSDGWIRLKGVTDIDSGGVAMAVDKLATVSRSSPPHALYIVDSSLTCSLNTLLSSLTKQSCTITTLVLGYCDLDKERVHCLCRYLSNTKITELYLYGNQITDIGVKYIVDHCPSNLTKLHLGRNLITDIGVLSIVKCCPSNLTYLNLGANRITDNGVKDMVHHFPSNLTVLDLGANKIADIGVEYIVDHCLSNLTQLHLAHNQITDVGVKYIADRCPSNLTVLDLIVNPVSGECRRRFGKFFKDNYPGLRFTI